MEIIRCRLTAHFFSERTRRISHLVAQRRAPVCFLGGGVKCDEVFLCKKIYPIMLMMVFE